MKFTHLVNLSAVGLFFGLGAMEQQTNTSTIQDTPFLCIKNKTTDCLQVVCKYFNENDERTLRIESEHKIELSQLMLVESLYIVKYGKWVKYSNSSYFTFGLVGPYNVMQDRNIAEFLRQQRSVKVKVTSSTKNITTAFTSNQSVQKLAAFFSPYSYEFTKATQKPIDKQDGFFLFDYFPRVKRAFIAEQEIHERYFLDLPEGATKHSGRQAYERACKIWIDAKGKSNNDPAKIKLAQDALKFIEAAWASLSLGDQFTSEFKSLVYAEEQFPTSYFFEQEPWTEEQIAAWIEMGGTYERENKGTSTANSGSNNTSNI